MNAVRAHLLAGMPHLADQVAQTHEEDPAVRVDWVRALVQLGRPDAATVVAGPLGVDSLAWAARALVDLSHGHPTRGDVPAPPEDPTDAVVFGLMVAEIARAAGDTAIAVSRAHTTRQAARALEDSLWWSHATLQLAACIHDTGDIELAGALCKSALDAFRSAVPESVAVAEALDQSGANARQRGDPKQAITFHTEALEIWKHQLGPDSPRIAGCLYSLAHAQHRSGDFPASLVTMQEALDRTVRAWGPDHLDAWITRFEVGRLAVDNGEMLDGFPQMEEARAVVASRLGPTHPVVRSMDRYL